MLQARKWRISLLKLGRLGGCGAAAALCRPHFLLAWIASLALGMGAATLGHRLFGCNINEGGYGGCPILGAVSGLALLGAFGAPLFILAIAACLIGAAVAFVFRRR